MRGWLAFSLVLTGCSAILGVRDIYLDDHAGANDGGTSDGSFANGDGSPAGDAACSPDLASDPKNCGRCGRDCLGAACAAGACDTIVLASGLVNPTSVALDGTNAYVTTYTDGRILSVPKAGGTVSELATGQMDAYGIVVRGGALFWSNGGFAYDPAMPLGTSRGGIWGCDLPSCMPRPIAPGDMAFNVVSFGDALYFAEQNKSSVRRVLPDGGGSVVLTSGATRVFSVAADATHVYFASSRPALYRIPQPDGGTEEGIGPEGTDSHGYVVLDDARIYWAYDNGGDPHVVSKPKDNVAGPAIEYATATTAAAPLGVTVDDSNVYWTATGTESAGISNSDGSVYACPKLGCPAGGPVVLAHHLPRPYGIAVDDTAVYFVEFTNQNQASGTLRKVAKP